MSKWLIKVAKKKGISVQEQRELMRQRSLSADKSTSGFASMDKDKLKEISSKAGKLSGISRKG